ncbi:MAG: TonB family protein [Bradymonadia bacterium]
MRCWTLLFSLGLILAVNVASADRGVTTQTSNNKTVTSDNALAKDATGETDRASGEPKGPKLTKAPALLKEVPAQYPPELFANGITGTVELLITIDENGDVIEADVKTGSGQDAFDTAAQEALFQFKFSPAHIDDKPAPVQIIYRYAFTISEQIVEKKLAEASAERENVGRLTGTVLQKGTRRPVVGLTVRLPKRGLETLTDENGRFAFEAIKAGRVLIELDDPDHYNLEDEEVVEAAKELEVKYYIEPTGLNENQVTVVGRRVKKEVARRTLTVQEIRKIPGASGDALKVVENLPGVARTPLSLGGLIVRGSNFGDSGAIVDRHFIPIPFHFGGLRSVIASEMIESIDFYPGNFGVENGRFSGGLIDIRLRRPRSDRFSGRFEADVFDSGVFLEGPLTEHLSIAVGARRSYIDFLIGSALGEIDDINFQTVPRYYDYQLILDYRKGRHQLKTFINGSDDEMVFVLNEPPAGNAALRGQLENRIGFVRGYASWTWRITDQLSNELSASLSRNILLLNFGPDIRVDNQAWQLTVREDLEYNISERFKWRTGFDYDGFFGTLDLNLPLPPKEGGGGQRGRSYSSVDFIEITRDFTLTNPAIWTELQAFFLDKRLLLVPGLRGEYDLLIEDYIVDPRITARFELLKDETAIKAGVGLFSQRPSPDESDKDFGDPDIEFERAVHVSVGVEQKLTELLEIDVVGFYKHLYNLIRPVTQSGIEDVFAAEPERRLENNGMGRSYGLELLFRHAPSERFFGWLSYTLMRSERRQDDGSGYRPFDFDQTHVLTVLGQYKLTNTWEVGARFQYSTGRPQTPFTGSVYNSDTDSYEGIPGEPNSARVPPYHRLDLRVDRNWIFDTWILSAYFEIQNVYNRANPERLNPNYDFTNATYSSGLPIIPSLGVRGQF